MRLYDLTVEARMGGSKTNKNMAVFFFSGQVLGVGISCDQMYIVMDVNALQQMFEWCILFKLLPCSVCTQKPS